MENIKLKEIPENENLKKVVNIVEKLLNFNEQQRQRRSILTFKQMLHGLPRVLAQVKTGNTSENLLNEIRQIVFLCIEITKKVYSNKMNLVKLKNKILLDLSSKINSKRSDKYVALSNLSICYIWKNTKKSYKIY